MFDKNYTMPCNPMIHHDAMIHRVTEMIYRALLRHQPTRHGIMQPPAAMTRKGGHKKYHELHRAPSTAQLDAHLAGTLTLATPATTNGQAACIIFDIDDHAADIIPQLLETIHDHGYWGWGEFHEATNRGYVWMPTSDLMPAQRLRDYGDTLINQTIHDPAQRAVIDNRTANQAITRLPFGRHTHTKRRGDLVLHNAYPISIEDEPDRALETWASTYQENDSATIEQEMLLCFGPYIPPTAATYTLPEALPERNTKGLFLTASEIQRAWNDRYTPQDHISEKGARPQYGNSRLWYCCCGNHANNDRDASLMIQRAKNPRYGRYVAQGWAKGCLFHTPDRRVFDAFNTYAALNSLNNAQMLKHAASVLGATLIGDTARRDYEGRQNSRQPQSSDTAPEADRAATKRATGPQNAPYTPKQRAAWDTAAWRLEQRIQIATDLTISNGIKAVYNALSEASSEHGYCRWSVIRIAKTAKVSEATTRRAIRQLLHAGRIAMAHVTTEQAGDQTNFYTIANNGTPAIKPPPEPAPKAKNTGGGLSSVTDTIKLSHVRGGKPPAPPQPSDSPASATEAAAPEAPPTPHISDSPIPAAEFSQPEAIAPQPGEAAAGAVFDSGIAAAFEARQPEPYSGIPRTKSDDQCRRELENRRGPHQPSPSAPESEYEPASSPKRRSLAPPYMPSKQPAAQIGLGLVALADEIARLEKQGRRYFAQKQPLAGRQMMAEAGRLKQVLSAGSVY